MAASSRAFTSLTALTTQATQHAKQTASGMIMLRTVRGWSSSTSKSDGFAWPMAHVSAPRVG